MMHAAKPQVVASCIDAPAENALVHLHGFNVLGWFFDTQGNAAVESVEARLGSTRVGSTRSLYDRSDVRTRHPGAGPRSGFELLCTIPEAQRSSTHARIDLYARYAGGEEIPVTSLGVRFSTIDYRNRGGHGYLLSDGFTRVLHRDDLYRSGPPSAVADSQCLNLLLRYIDVRGSVLDVGCGIGAYGAELRRRNIDWHGIEVVPSFCAQMNELGLPNTLVEPGAIPFADRSFDSAISVEVLEHVGDYETFVAEIARVVRGTACFSVPNAETIPLLSYMHLLPWHMLESDHKNFFSRLSLAALLARHFASVEVFPYGNLPHARSYEGVPIPNHLFAIAKH